ncbi:MAG: hypothetical protein HIU82_21900 [Proteobacteria bacterium]|nr:hypothetical protein [Pseudomonadota bacterium]
MPLLSHKFKVGQMVEFLPGPRDANVPRGRYKVQRLMPSETGDPQYRVKHAADSHERVIAESQLAAEPGVWRQASSGNGPIS